MLAVERSFSRDHALTLHLGRSNGASAPRRPRHSRRRVPGDHPGAGHARRGAQPARRMAGVGGAVPPRAVRQAGADDPASTPRGSSQYLDTRMTNGPVGGINNKLRVIARRAYGFHSHGPLISMLYLCCGGIELATPRPIRL